jgi:CelD/BcsL family acetyltransferase involved in cellulose biosynthesis
MRGLGIALHDSLAGLRESWSDLAEASGCIFSTWEWLECWWRHFGRDRPLFVGSCTADGHAVALIPMYLAAHRPVRVLRLMGHSPSDQLGPICHFDVRAEVAMAWSDLLSREITEWDLLLADELPGGTDWPTALGGTHLAFQASPLARMSPGGWPEWIASRSSNFRATLSRARRQLETFGTVRFRQCNDGEQFEDDFSALVRLHVLRWRELGRQGGFARREEFHREFGRIAFDRGWLRLHILELDHQIVGALYNFRFGSAESFYLSGRDPRLAKASIGLLLHAHAIQEAHEDGMTEYRFLRGAEAYKRRFADNDEPLEAVAVTRGPTGAVALRGLRHLPVFPSWARSRVPAALAWGTGAAPKWGPP